MLSLLARIVTALTALSLFTGCTPRFHTRKKSDLVVRLANIPKERIDGQLLGTMLAPDAIRSVDSPQFHLPGDAGSWPPHRRVLGVSRGGEAKAYPLTILNRHELVNDRIGNDAIAVAWCPILQGGKGFVRRLGGDEVTLGISGKIWGNGLVAFDRPTGSLFTLWDGHALRGTWRGHQLESFPVVLSTIERWLKAHPKGRVMAPLADPPGLTPRQRDRLGFGLVLRPNFLRPPSRLRRLHSAPEPASRLPATPSD